MEYYIDNSVLVSETFFMCIECKLAIYWGKYHKNFHNDYCELAVSNELIELHNSQ